MWANKVNLKVLQETSCGPFSKLQQRWGAALLLAVAQPCWDEQPGDGSSKPERDGPKPSVASGSLGDPENEATS